MKVRTEHDGWHVVTMTTAEICAAIGPITVDLDPHDALTAGSSMLVLVHTGRVPDQRTQEIYRRVGQQLVAAVRAKQLEPSNSQHQGT